jgi:hypothetical protein
MPMVGISPSRTLVSLPSTGLRAARPMPVHPGTLSPRAPLFHQASDGVYIPPGTLGTSSETDAEGVSVLSPRVRSDNRGEKTQTPLRLLPLEFLSETYDQLVNSFLFYFHVIDDQCSLVEQRVRTLLPPAGETRIGTRLLHRFLVNLEQMSHATEQSFPALQAFPTDTPKSMTEILREEPDPTARYREDLFITLFHLLTAQYALRVTDKLEKALKGARTTNAQDPRIPLYENLLECNAPLSMVAIVKSQFDALAAVDPIRGELFIEQSTGLRDIIKTFRARGFAPQPTRSTHGRMPRMAAPSHDAIHRLVENIPHRMIGTMTPNQSIRLKRLQRFHGCRAMAFMIHGKNLPSVSGPRVAPRDLRYASHFYTMGRRLQDPIIPDGATAQVATRLLIEQTLLRSDLHAWAAVPLPRFDWAFSLAIVTQQLFFATQPSRHQTINGLMRFHSNLLESVTSWPRQAFAHLADQAHRNRLDALVNYWQMFRHERMLTNDNADSHT